ncbi:hypothetical protein [Nonomuraea sp. NPDC046570]|uniref:hypothetical protein n=1 Tax=Nonomuraea sp. NPDC046570 TaxID=3155255 RepID=UPI0033C7F07F
MSTTDATSALVPVTLDTLSGRELRDLIDPVIVHADPTPEQNADLPELTLVSVEVYGGMLYLAATDRYTLGVTRHQIPDDQPRARGAIAVPAAALRKALRSIAARDLIRLSVDRDGLSLTHADTTALTHRVPASPMTFPLNWRRHLGAWMRTPRADAAPTGLNPAYLARFTHAARGGLPLELRTIGTPSRPQVLITCGTHFLGAVSPIRLSVLDDNGTRCDDPLTPWLAVCPPAALTAPRKAAA